MKCLQHHFSQLYDYLNTTIEYLEKNLLHKNMVECNRKQLHI